MQSNYPQIARDIRNQAASGDPADLSSATARLGRLREVLAGSIDTDTARKIKAGFVLVLSAPAAVGQGDTSRLTELLKKVCESGPAVDLPTRPHDRQALIVGAAIGKLIDQGWEYTGTFEPTITLLVKGAHKIQFEQGGTPLSSRREPGTHFDRAYTSEAGEIWTAARAGVESDFERGRATIVAEAARTLPGLAPVLESTANWRELPEGCLEKAQLDDPLAVLAFIEGVSGTAFVANLLIDPA